MKVKVPSVVLGTVISLSLLIALSIATIHAKHPTRGINAGRSPVSGC